MKAIACSNAAVDVADRSIGCGVAAALMLFAGLCLGNAAMAEQGRLRATGGATQVEGSAGGGIVPWAVLSGYGTEDENGGSAFFTRVDSGDYALNAWGAAYTFRNRVELSLARQRFDLGELRRLLGLPFEALEQDVFGAKVRLGGDLIYTAMPQISLGVQHKRLRDDTLPLAVGARDGSGTDVYVSATKLWLDAAGGYPLLLNGTLRSTNANQIGLLGFGGDRKSGRSLVFEASAAVLPTPELAIGIEYRQKPDNLGFAREERWRDVFVGWFPNKRVAVVAAWADLGSIATLDRQRGGYLSVQLSY